MATMQEIERLMEKLGAARDVLAGTVMARDDEVAQVQKKHLPRIRRLAAQFKAAADAVTEAVAASPELFVKPRSIILHGIKAGFQKGRGGLHWDDDDKVVALVRKHFAEQFDVLVKTTHTPVKDALDQLPADDLKKLGIAVIGTGDVPFVRLADSEIARMVRALLREASAEVES